MVEGRGMMFDKLWYPIVIVFMIITVISSMNCSCKVSFPPEDKLIIEAPELDINTPLEIT